MENVAFQLVKTKMDLISVEATGSHLEIPFIKINSS